MKNGIALLVTILLVSGLWSFAQVAPQPQPKPEPQPQPQPAPVQPAQPKGVDVAPAPPAADFVEIRVEDQANDFFKRGQFDRAFAAQTAQVQAGQAAVAAREAFLYKQKTEKGCYIGLGTSPIPTVLRDQLKLPNGSGLVVDRVEGNSPAEAAGIKVSDIIQKLDDQVLINPHQFGVLVRNLKPDTDVKLSIIRETKPQTVDIKPVEKDLAPLDEMAAYGAAGPWRENQITAAPRYGGGNGFFTMKNNNKLDKPGADTVDFVTTTDQMQMVTDNGTTRITTTIGNKGERRANVVDKATGKIIFDGPIETEEQRQALPKEVQDQLKELDQMKLKAPIGIRALPTPKGINIDGRTLRITNGQQNNLPKPKSVSGSDDDYTWEFTTKTDENGKPELELLLLDKNGKILFQGPFSRSRDTKTLPGPMAERLSTYPWSMIIDDLKSTGGGNGMNVKFAPGAPGAGGPAGFGGGAPGADNNFAPTPKNRPAK
jgi:hypothetical protein